jgi:hypothetical protein
VTDGGTVKILVTTDDGPMKMPVAVAVAAHVQQLKRFLKAWRIKPFIKERRRELLDGTRFCAGLFTACNKQSL